MKMNKQKGDVLLAFDDVNIVLRPSFENIEKMESYTNFTVLKLFQQTIKKRRELENNLEGTNLFLLMPELKFSDVFLIIKCFALGDFDERNLKEKLVINSNFLQALTAILSIVRGVMMSAPTVGVEDDEAEKKT